MLQVIKVLTDYYHQPATLEKRALLLILGRRLITVLLLGFGIDLGPKQERPRYFMPSILNGTLQEIMKRQTKHAEADHRVTYSPCTFF